MPQIDLPLKELRKYLGINPCPPDFDHFWERAGEEVYSIDPEPEFTPADFKTDYAHCYDLTFTSVGKVRIHARYSKPVSHTGENPALLQFHGYTINAGDWFDKLPFTAAGFHVFAMDCRGQGGRSEASPGLLDSTLRGHIIKGLEDGPEHLSYRQIFLDTVQLARVAAAAEGVDAERMGAMGGSQGGALTLACGALYPSLKKIVPMYPFLCDYKRVWDLDLGKQAYEEMIQFFKRFDPEHKREDEIFTTLGYIDVQFLAPRVQAEVLMCTNLMDEVCPPSTQFAAYNKIPANKKMKIYPDFAHERPPEFMDHAFRFLMGLRD
jgi:cephalosporin-C deacetylase